MKLKKVGNTQSLKNYKINIKLNSYYKDKFYVNDQVITKKDKQRGIVSKINKDFVFVTYANKTIERFDKTTAKQYLEYVDDVETQVSPLTPQNLQADDFSKLPIDKLAENEYNKLKAEKQLSEKEIQVDNIVKLGIQKGLIDPDDYEQEKLICLTMGENELQAYIDNINEFNSQSIVYSQTDDDDKNLSEGELMLKKIKDGGSITAGNIDFSKFSSKGSSRSLMDISGVPTGVDALKKTASMPPVLNNFTNSEDKQFNKYGFLDEMNWTLYNRN